MQNATRQTPPTRPDGEAGAAAAEDTGPTGPSRSRRSLVLLAMAGVALFALFVALGTWQVERRSWKLALIERVEARVHAQPAAAPGPDRWPGLNAGDSEYRHVRLTGTFLHDHETLVQAATELGAGYWVLTPLRTDEGWLVLVNRGFVPPEYRTRASRADGEPSGEVVLTGLLRMTEPGGGFLRHNDPAANRWFSRDVQAIAAARGIAGKTAPYFVDADAVAEPLQAGAGSHAPVGGLTVIAFHNSHLVYAITWYALALMVAAAAWQVARAERRPGKPDR